MVLSKLSASCQIAAFPRGRGDGCREEEGTAGSAPSAVTAAASCGIGIALVIARAAKEKKTLDFIIMNGYSIQEQQSSESVGRSLFHSIENGKRANLSS